MVNLVSTHKDDNQLRISVDVVPLLPINEKDLPKLYGIVASTLLEEKPVNWDTGFKKYMSIDRPTLEGFVDLNARGKEDLLVAMKALHYGKSDNFIMSPGQTNGIETFHKSDSVRECFILLKARINLVT